MLTPVWLVRLLAVITTGSCAGAVYVAIEVPAVFVNAAAPLIGSFALIW